MTTFFESIAGWLEVHFGRAPAVTSNELHFDSDAYLAEIRNRAFKHYY